MVVAENYKRTSWNSGETARHCSFSCWRVSLFPSKLVAVAVPVAVPVAVAVAVLVAVVPYCINSLSSFS